VLCGGLVDASDQEVDHVDIGLHSKCLLHKNCMYTDDFIREGKSDYLFADTSQMCIPQEILLVIKLDKPSCYYFQRKRLRRNK
jgi:hypothetical protein